MDVQTVDVLVLGCGPAGLFAALEARRLGCRVLACDKGLVGHDCSAVGAKQLAAVGEWSVPRDSPDRLYGDLMASGCAINDERLVRVMAERSGHAVAELQRLGMPFERDAGGRRIAVEGPAAGHSCARSLFFSDITGKLLVETLHAAGRRHGVRYASEHAAVDLVTAGNHVTGALLLRKAAGELLWVRAKAVVLATGGLGQMYALTSNPIPISGDGVAVGLRAGAQAMDLEFVQFYPVTALYPPLIRGMNLNCHDLGARLINAEGDRFMARRHPELLEHVTRDVLAQEVFREIREGRVGPHGGVYLDATAIPADLYAAKVPSEWKLLCGAGVDPTREYLEVAPAAHYAMGGLAIDATCATGVTGLFAAGECTAGVQGANRLANAGLTEAVVFGAIAGKSAGEYAAGVAGPPETSAENVAAVQARIAASFDEAGLPGSRVVARVQRLMAEHAGILRDEASLHRAEEALAELEDRKVAAKPPGRWDPTFAVSLAARNMLLLGRVIVRAAGERRESRGAHAREDFPSRDDVRWRCNLLVSLGPKGELRVVKRGKLVSARA